MAKYKCIYCGSDKLTYAESELYPYICPECGIRFTKLDFDTEIERLNQASGSDVQEKADEEAVLETAWQLMLKQQWDAALDVLFRCRYPFAHPAEFLFWRSICQTVPLLGKSDLSKRYESLDNLLNNLNHFDYFSPDDDQELDRSLKRIHQALMLMSRQPIYDRTAVPLGVSDIKEQREGCTDETCRRLAAVLGTFAERLELRYNASHNIDYLKMTAELWTQCLERGQDGFIAFSDADDHFLHLPALLRQQIVTKIKQLNALIMQQDPQYVPLKLPRQPIAILHHIFTSIFITLVIPAAVALMLWLATYIPYNSPIFKWMLH